MKQYADIALGVPQDEPYQYLIPPDLQSQIQVGVRAKVPLRSQTKIGYVVGVSEKSVVPYLKPITEIIDQESFVSRAFLELTRWMSDYYFCSWGQAIETAMPAPFKKGKTTMKSRIANTSTSLVHATPVHELTEEQAGVVETIQAKLQQKCFSHFLLHGVTGSGKTEVYLRLIEGLIKEGRGSIVLVPEISLTPQTTQRFKARFGNEVAVVHSRISMGKRLEEWHRLRKGEARVVVGARSAIFSPVQNLSLVIIDEEHDDSYKQGETPRYEAGRVAEKRCQIENAVLLKASATPALESFYSTKSILNLPHRIAQRPLPEVQIVDMRQERAGRSIRLFSVVLENAIRKALDQKEQIMLLMNRRGFSPYVNCPSCGAAMQCRKCRVSLVFHHDISALLCHICHYKIKPPRICPACDKGNLF